MHSSPWGVSSCSLCNIFIIYVTKAVTEGVVQLNLSLPVPTIFGVLTVENEVQAKERIGGKQGHNGEKAAVTALKMIALNNKIKNKK